MTPEAGRRAPFELLAFTAAPVAGALVVIELEGRFAAQGNGRFTRRPVLVIETDDDRPRLELAPVRGELHDAYWRGAYAIPAEALAGARFALGLRGTLLELPAPDEADDSERLATLAREVNGLRRALEAAEADAATAHAESDAASAELGAAVRTARDSALAESSNRVAALEAELVEVRRTTAEEITAARKQATERAEAADQRAAEAEACAQAAQRAAQAATAGTDVLRAELAEERDRARSAVTEITAVPPHSTPTHATTHRGPGPWIAVAALVLFAVALLVLFLG